MCWVPAPNMNATSIRKLIGKLHRMAHILGNILWVISIEPGLKTVCNSPVYTTFTAIEGILV